MHYNENIMSFMKYLKEYSDEDSKNDVDRFKEAVSDAEHAFWASIADSYSEVTRGDLDPGTTIGLQEAMSDAVHTWLKYNKE